MKSLSLTVMLLVLGLAMATHEVLGQSGTSNKDRNPSGNAGKQNNPQQRNPQQRPGGTSGQGEGNKQTRRTRITEMPSPREAPLWRGTNGRPLGSRASGNPGQENQGKKRDRASFAKEGEKLTPPGKDALGKLIQGTPLTTVDQAALSGALASRGVSLSRELQDFIKEGLLRDKLDQVCRVLVIQNKAGERLTIWVQYFTTTTTGARKWFPSDPEKGTTAVPYVLAPNQTGQLVHEDWTIRASRVRLWAKSGSQEWQEYKEKDLVLNLKNNEIYLDNPKDPFVFTFR